MVRIRAASTGHWSVKEWSSDAWGGSCKSGSRRISQRDSPLDENAATVLETSHPENNY